MCKCEPAYCIAEMRTKEGGGYQVRPSNNRSAQLRDHHHSSYPHLEPYTTQGKAKHAGKLGALQLVRAVPVGVASQVALGDRCVGLRDSIYTGLENGRNAMLSYDGAADRGSACAVVDRLMAIARQGGAIGSPGTLRGHPLSMEHLMESDEDKMWVSARAKEQTTLGTIWVHESSTWARALRKRPYP